MKKQTDSILIDITIKTMESSLSRTRDKLKNFETYITTPGIKNINTIKNYLHDIRCVDSDFARFSISFREAGVNEGYISLLAPQTYGDISLGFNSGMSSGFNNRMSASPISDIKEYHQEILDLINDFRGRNEDILEILKTIRRKYNDKKDV